MNKLPWMEWAEGELGEKEVPGRFSNPRIMQYRDIAGCHLEGEDGEVPWCKIFVNAAFVSVGLPIDRSAMARSIERDRNFLKLNQPAYGAVVVFWRKSMKSGSGHIGFYCGENRSGSRIYTLGGNESDAVRKAWFPANAHAFGLIGYYFPRQFMQSIEYGRILVHDDGSPFASAA